MKGSQSSKKKKNKFSRRHFFDTVVILAILNVIAFILIVFYKQQIIYNTSPQSGHKQISIDSIPLPLDIDSINASAAAYVVFDTKNRTVIAGKNKDLRFSPASTAKVMSALVALDYYDPEQYLVVPDNIYSVQGSKMRLIPGEEVKVVDLIYGMMLPSGNDAAYTIAYYYKNGYDDFIKAMNEKADELKLFNTEFKDPAGLDDGNYTTGEDLVRLGAYAMQNDLLSKVVGTRYHEVYSKDFTHTFYLENLNELLVFDNVKGIKTGFTNEAGGVLLTALEKGDTLFIVCVLKSNDRFYDTRDLMEFIIQKVEFALPPTQNYQ